MVVCLLYGLARWVPDSSQNARTQQGPVGQMIRDTIANALKDAQREKDRRRISTLRGRIKAICCFTQSRVGFEVTATWTILRSARAMIARM